MTLLPRRRFLRLVLPALLLPLPSCDAVRDEDDPLDPGTFEARITEGDQLALRGTALFGLYTSPVTKQRQYVVHLSEGTQSEGVSVYFIRDNEVRPRQGRYELLGEDADLGPTQLYGLFLVIRNGASEQAFEATSGSVTVTTSNDERIAGSFDFTAAAPGASSLRLQGSFEAQAGVVFLPDR